MKKLIASVFALVCIISVSALCACGTVNAVNESSDMQIVKNMNTALSAEEVVKGKPQDVSEVIEICSENGFDVTKISLVTDGAVLYWDSGENLILIWSEDTSSVIYPYSYDSVTSVSDTWYLLTDAE